MDGVKKIPLSASIVIPVFNNERTVSGQLSVIVDDVLPRIRTWELILCDDGSRDRTYQLLARRLKDKKGVRLIRHVRNLGIARTLKELYGTASKEHIVLFSIDGDWDPYDILRLLSKVEKDGSDVVIGMRNKQVYSMYRKLISYTYNLLPYLFFGVRTHDAGSIKVFRRSVYRSLPVVSDSLFFEAEFIIRAVRKGYAVSSLPVSFRRESEIGQTGGRPANVRAAAIDLARFLVGGRA
jgi:glycosyltransferase involved in cell wall biosynthesis